ILLRCTRQQGRGMDPMVCSASLRSLLRPWMTTRRMFLPVIKGRGPATQAPEIPLAFRLPASMLRSQIAQLVPEMPPDIPTNDLKK
ncbi:hypothetical protein, partial [Mesorhizobium sp. BH1-1-4]|uniref:hypothetical protein n=1 Tax=Mesorhizobium sp. BH1-1-4 TaxID=2876662 RepID=UPI001CD14242